MALPLPLRLLNAGGQLLRAGGFAVLELEGGALCRQATRNTGGLEDFGDPAFRTPLGRLIDSLENEADLTPLGRMIAKRDIVRLLENRLYMTAELKRRPEISEAGIERPLFIIGLPRTGTSILHELFAQDPANRVPMTWEALWPWPPPESATFESDPRIGRAEKQLAGVDRVVPGFKAMHRMGARLPQECVALTAHDFASMIFHTSYNVPSYQQWLDGADLVPVYASHKRQLQYLQSRHAAERWVLKSPGHLWALEALLAAYPDARIVQTHRDPLKVVASLSSLVTLLRGMVSQGSDRLAVASDWSPRLAQGLRYSMEARDRLVLGPEQIMDLQFKEFLKDEIAAVASIYDHFGMEFSAQAEARMRKFLADHPHDKHGKHSYRLSDSGLDEKEERARYADYQERFSVASEAVN
jgi:hypothetical protein